MKSDSQEISALTVFMFSIQMASTGPSNRSHLRSVVVDCACARYELARTPSDHSWDTGSNDPYSDVIGIDFGLMSVTHTCSTPRGAGSVVV